METGTEGKQISGDPSDRREDVHAGHSMSLMGTREVTLRFAVWRRGDDGPVKFSVTLGDKDNQWTVCVPRVEEVETILVPMFASFLTPLKTWLCRQADQHLKP